MKTNDLRLRDPYIFAENGKYYIYGSEVLTGQNQTFFTVYESTDLENWNNGKVIFKRPDGFSAKDNFWAPELHKYNGKYYIFASFEWKCMILVCDTPDGEFVPLTGKPISPEGWDCIDGTLYVNKEGTPYIVFYHEEFAYKSEKWKIIDGGLYALELAHDLKSAVGEPKLLLNAADYKNNKTRGNNHEIRYISEGPFLYRTDERLYILFSGFREDFLYFEAAAYSDNGEIDGNWIFQDEYIFSNDGGHGMIFKDLAGNPKLVLHYPNKGNGIEYPLIFDIKEENGKLIIK